MRQLILGLSGKRGSGKDTLGRALRDNAPFWLGVASDDVLLTAMAFKLKELCIDILGLPAELVYGTNEQKETPTQYEWGNLPHWNSIDYFLQLNGSAKEPVMFHSEAKIWSPRNSEKHMTVREVLQQVGTEIFRRMNTNVWSEACIRHIHKEKKTLSVVCDVRFPCEVEAIHKAGGKVIRLTRTPHLGDTHESETALDYHNFDHSRFDAIIDNASMTPRVQEQALFNALQNFGWATRAN